MTVLAWAGPAEARELVGLAADAAIEIVSIAPDAVAAVSTGVVTGEVTVAGRAARVLDLQELGRP